MSEHLRGPAGTGESYPVALRGPCRGFLGGHARPRCQPEHRGAVAPHRGAAAAFDPRLRLRAGARPCSTSCAAAIVRSAWRARRPWRNMARTHSGCEVWEQDFLESRSAPGSFHGIFANASLFHVPRPELPRVLRQLQASLKPDGVLFSSNPRGDNQESINGERYGAYHDLRNLEGIPDVRRVSPNWSITIDRPACRASNSRGWRAFGGATPDRSTKEKRAAARFSVVLEARITSCRPSSLPSSRSSSSSFFSSFFISFFSSFFSIFLSSFMAPPWEAAKEPAETVAKRAATRMESSLLM
jgi:hypothetical protein